jgi:formamidopyrimidine-DNA glycosylase
MIMPELPEVHTIVTELNPDISNKTISDICVYWEKSLFKILPMDFIQKVKNQKILKISRRGKNIVIQLENVFMIIHLKMSGKLLYFKNRKAIDKHERVRFILDDGYFFSFNDVRKFGKIYLTKNIEDFFKNLGVEPLEQNFTKKYLKTVLEKKSICIKPFLLDQKYIVGIGNIYADEALFLAKINPQKKCRDLDDQNISNLHTAIIRVLKSGIENKGTSLGVGKSNYVNAKNESGSNQNNLLVYSKENKPCINCSSLIKRIKLSGRSTHFCPICQK